VLAKSLCSLKLCTEALLGSARVRATCKTPTIELDAARTEYKSINYILIIWVGDLAAHRRCLQRQSMLVGCRETITESLLHLAIMNDQIW
jgi:hypothetical protein